MATQAAQPENYIDLILGTRVRVLHATPAVAQALAALGGQQEPVGGTITWVVQVADDAALAALLEQLRDLGVLFLNEAAGWPPAAIFADLRAKGQVRGPYQEIAWRGPNQWFVATR